MMDLVQRLKNCLDDPDRIGWYWLLRDAAKEIERLRAERDRLLDREAAQARKLERLEATARAVIDRWHTPLWKDAEPTVAVIQRLQAALRGEGESGPC